MLAKIKLQLSKPTILCVSGMLNKIYELPVSNIQQENIYKSIGYDLAEKFHKKAITIKKTTSLKPGKNKSDVSLKYHEAWALHEILHDLLQIIPLDTYYQALISKLLITLHQKTI